MNYIEYNFTITPMGIASEILVAELAEVGFESFVDTDNGLLAYMQEPLWHTLHRGKKTKVPEYFSRSP